MPAAQNAKRNHIAGKISGLLAKVMQSHHYYTMQASSVAQAGCHTCFPRRSSNDPSSSKSFTILLDQPSGKGSEPARTAYRAQGACGAEYLGCVLVVHTCKRLYICAHVPHLLCWSYGDMQVQEGVAWMPVRKPASMLESGWVEWWTYHEGAAKQVKEYESWEHKRASSRLNSQTYSSTIHTPMPTILEFSKLTIAHPGW